MVACPPESLRTCGAFVTIWPVQRAFGAGIGKACAKLYWFHIETHKVAGQDFDKSLKFGRLRYIDEPLKVPAAAQESAGLPSR